MAPRLFCARRVSTPSTAVVRLSPINPQHHIAANRFNRLSLSRSYRDYRSRFERVPYNQTNAKWSSPHVQLQSLDVGIWILGASLALITASCYSLYLNVQNAKAFRNQDDTVKRAQHNTPRRTPSQTPHADNILDNLHSNLIQYVQMHPENKDYVDSFLEHFDEISDRYREKIEFHVERTYQNLLNVAKQDVPAERSAPIASAILEAAFREACDMVYDMALEALRSRPELIAQASDRLKWLKPALDQIIKNAREYLETNWAQLRKGLVEDKPIPFREQFW